MTAVKAPLELAVEIVDANGVRTRWDPNDDKRREPAAGTVVQHQARRRVRQGSRQRSLAASTVTMLT